MDRQGENLRQLLGRFMPAQRAGEALDDIERGEQILRDNPAPEPRPELLLAIKAELAEHLAVRRRHGLTWLVPRLAAAAAMVVLASVGFRLVGTGRDKPNLGRDFAGLIPAAIWESDNIEADDVSLAYISTELERIENELRSLSSGETQDDESAVDEVEMELKEIEAEFWKG